MEAVKLSTLLSILGLLLILTTRSWSQWWNSLRDRRTLNQIYQDFGSGKQPPSSLYARVVTPVALMLMIAGMYTSCSGR